MLTVSETVIWTVGGCFAVISYLLYSSNQTIELNIGTRTYGKAAFQASRLTSSTFLIKEYDDIWLEHPHIYAKIVPAANTILIIDTGCGGLSKDSTIKIKSLRKFIESVKVDDSNASPLNEGGRMDYVVALTHCHYDHILGVEGFSADSPILASGHSPSFLAKDAIAENSECNAKGIKTPNYEPTLVPHGHLITSHGSKKDSLGVTVFHTPGHTPDEIALFDEAEMMLYVGDTLYEYEPIIFPKAGSIVTWFSSMHFLVSFVKEKNTMLSVAKNTTQPSEVLINAGHVTALRPALDVLLATVAFMKDVVEGREKVKERYLSRGEAMVMYSQADNRFSLVCPERLVIEARPSGNV